jgi:hypothetical protein
MTVWSVWDHAEDQGKKRNKDVQDGKDRRDLPQGLGEHGDFFDIKIVKMGRMKKSSSILLIKRQRAA